VIAKISEPRGARVAGLVYYLFGPGRREEHVNPHLTTGRPALRLGGKPCFGRVNIGPRS
jgi:hypothetical protein